MGYAFSKDGQLVAEASGSQMVRVWNTATGQLIHSLNLGQWASCVAFSPDGKHLAGGSGYWNGNFFDPESDQSGSLHVWEVSSGRTVFAPEGFPLNVWDISFSPDGKLLAAAMGEYVGNAGKSSTVRVWDTVTWQQVWNLRGHTECLFALAYSPNGKRLAAAGGQFRAGRNPNERTALPVSGASTVGLLGAPLSQGPLLTASAVFPGRTEITIWKHSGELTIWDVSPGQEVWTMPNTKETIFGVAFSPDGRRLATSSADGTVKIWDGTPLAETPSRDTGPAGE
jgi:hypothetical protein